jgi:hypothetical protein
MAEVKEVNLNRVGLTLARMYDPVAVRLDWKPFCRTSPVFKSYGLIVSRSRATVKRSITLWLASLASGGLGILSMGFALRELVLQSDRIGLALSLFLLGSFLTLLGLVAAFGRRELTFDKKRGLYYRGKAFNDDALPHRNRQGSLSEIHAVQVTGKPVHSSKGNVAALRTYEINLVFRDGYRVNVLDYGNTDSVEKSARVLGKFLGVPVWSASY